MAAIVLSNVFYAYGESLNAAFLPELARREALGRVSGWGWSFGYFGGMLTLGLCLAYVLWAQAQGMPGDAVRAGDDAHHRRRLWRWRRCATFALLKERAVPQPAALRDGGLRASLQRLRQTWRQARDYRDFVWLLACARGLPGGHLGGHRAGGGVCRAGAGLQADRDHDADLPGQHRVGASARSPSATGRTASATPRAGRHAGRLDRDDGAGRALATSAGAVLGGGGDGRAVHGLEPVGRPRDGRRCSRRRSGWPSSSGCGPLRCGWRRSSGR